MTKPIITHFKFLKNKYSRWHNAIIKRARKRKLDDYRERHHIIPRSLGGSNDDSNLVDLTFREHFLVHWLLTKMTERSARRKMLSALNWICNGNGVWKQKNKNIRSGRGIIPSWKYDLARRAARESQIGRKRPGLHSAEFRAKISARSKGNQYAKGKTHIRTPEFVAKLKASYTPERRAEISAREKGNQHSKGFKHSSETRAKWSIARKGRVGPMTGKTHSLEARIKMSEAHCGVKRPDISALMKGRKRSPESIAKTAAAHRGRKNSPETIAKMKANCFWKGKKNPKLSLALKGRKMPWVAEANKKRAALALKCLQVQQKGGISSEIPPLN